MGCFRACFGDSKRRKPRKSATPIPSSDHALKATEAVHPLERAEEGDEVSASLNADSLEKLEEQIDLYHATEITSDTIVEDDEVVPTPAEEVIDNLDEIKKEEKSGEEDDERRGSSNLSTAVSLPLNHRYADCPNSDGEYLEELDHLDEEEEEEERRDALNHRYADCPNSDDEYLEELDHLEEEERRDGSGGDDDGDGKSKLLIEEASSDSLFSLSIDSRRQFCTVEAGEKEVNSHCSSDIQLDKASPDEKMGCRSQNVDSVLNPIECISHSNAAKVKTALPPVHHLEKENIISAKAYGVHHLEKENIISEKDYGVHNLEKENINSAKAYGVHHQKENIISEQDYSVHHLEKENINSEKDCGVHHLGKENINSEEDYDVHHLEKNINSEKDCGVHHLGKENINSVKEYTVHHLEKENINSEKDYDAPISPEPTFKRSLRKLKGNYSNLKPAEEEIAVDTSLSNWLVESETTPKSKSSTSSIGNSPMWTRNSAKSYEDRPILGALTLEELRQFSASSTPRRSRSRSPETPIIGTVGSYWSHTGQDADLSPGSSCRGSTKTTRKSREDEKVHWNSTPFLERLDMALASNSAEV